MFSQKRVLNDHLPTSRVVKSKNVREAHTVNARKVEEQKELPRRTWTMLSD